MPQSSEPRSAPHPKHPPTDSTNLQVLSAELGSLFAPRPLIPGEAANEYDTLLAKVTAAARPEDTLEALWVHDIVDLMWEAYRLRRLKARLLAKAGQEAVAALIAATPGAGQMSGTLMFTASDLALCYAQGDAEAILEVRRVLQSHGLDEDALMAQVLADTLPEIEHIERLVAGAEARRTRALREIRQHREALARRLRRIATEIPDLGWAATSPR